MKNVYNVLLCWSGDFMGSAGGYEDIVDMKNLKKFMENQLSDYNHTPGAVHMDLVLFRDAIEHSTSENTNHNIWAFQIIIQVNVKSLNIETKYIFCRCLWALDINKLWLG